MSESDQEKDRTQTHTVLSKGTMVAHYRIEKKIGAGGMGEVYLAKDTKLKRKVALKFLSQHLSQDGDCRKRFTREAQSVAKLNHPNIITIHEVSEYQGRPFFAMEHVEGQSLKEVIKDQEISLDFIIDIAIQICEGLSKAHQLDIVHRDVKPSNIVIDADGRPKLLDFGLATVQGGEQLTKTGSTLGTVGYMSPEQIEGKEADARSDLFSLGVILYEMIAGKVPFRGDNETATLKAVLQDSPEPLARYKSDVPDDLQRIVSKLLEKDRSLRYQSADGIIPDLKKLSPSVTSSVMSVKKGDWWNRYVVPTAIIIPLIAFGYWYVAERYQGGDNSGTDQRIMLAVLPFENLGDPEDEYFADGMTDEITSRLAMVHNLGVISRTSSYAYKNSDKALPEIAKELGVDYILEGTIRWDKSGEVDRVRITPQLISVSDDIHLWASNYEKALTQVFAVQADIATQISEALNIALLDPERQSIETEPTQNIEAYHYFLRGKQYWADRTSGINPAIQMLEKAVELDTTYFQAYALLARLYGYIHINNLDPDGQYFQKAQDAADKALRFAEGHSDGYLAMGYFHYYCSRDYDRALEQFEIAKKGQPNNSELLEAIGYVQRRQGRWDEALANQQKAHRIDPLDISKSTGLTRTLFNMHRLFEARQLINQGFEYEIDHPGLYLWNIWIESSITGDTAVLRVGLNELEQHANQSLFEYWAETADILLRNYKSAILRRNTPGDFETADSSEFYSNKGFIYALMGKDDRSYDYYDSARVSCEQRLESQPNNADTRSDLAEAYAGLGRHQEAIAEAKTAVELLPISKDALSGSNLLAGLARVYVMTGEHELAIDVLDTLLRIPSSIQVNFLRLHPSYDPLRDNPRFEAMLEKYGKEHGI